MRQRSSSNAIAISPAATTATRCALATVVAAATLLASTAAGAAVHTFQQGAGGYAGMVDTGLRATDPDTPLGAEPELSVDASDGGLPSQALIRFGALFGSGAGQVGTGQTIVQATLTLNITSAGSGMRLFDMLAPFNAASITWNGAIGGIQTDGAEAAMLPFLQVGANNGGTNIGAGLLVLDVTSALQRQQVGATPGFGWALLPFMPDGTNGVDFISAEGADVADRPLLTLVTAPVPEPGTALLALAGAVALASRLRAGQPG